MPLFYLLGIWWGFQISLCHPQEILAWFNSEQGCYRSCSRLRSCQKSCRKHSRAPTTAGTNSITFSQPQYSPLPETEKQNLRDLFKLLYRFWGERGGVGAFGASFPSASYIRVPMLLRTEGKHEDFVACLAKHRLQTIIQLILQIAFKKKTKKTLCQMLVVLGPS